MGVFIVIVIFIFFSWVMGWDSPLSIPIGPCDLLDPESCGFYKGRTVRVWTRYTAGHPDRTWGGTPQSNTGIFLHI